MSQRRRIRPITGAILAGFLVAGCAQDIRKSGYYPLAEDLALVQVGQSNKNGVIAALGTPTAGIVETDNVFYYVGQRTRYFGPFEPQIIDRQIVAVSFDGKGRVANVVTYGLEDGAVIVMNSRITDPIGGDISMLRQMFGAIGRVNAGQLLN